VPHTHSHKFKYGINNNPIVSNACSYPFYWLATQLTHQLFTYYSPFYAGDPTEMVVMWTTFHPTNHSVVLYGEQGMTLTNSITGEMMKFVDGGDRHIVRYMHTVTLTGLKPASKYGRYSTV